MLLARIYRHKPCRDPTDRASHTILCKDHTTPVFEKRLAHRRLQKLRYLTIDLMFGKLYV